MSVYTLFHIGNIQTFESNAVDDQRFAKEYASFIKSTKFNILDYTARTFAIPGSSSSSVFLDSNAVVTDWWVIYAKVLGSVRFSIRYDDPENPGSTLISKCSCQGDQNFPGFFNQSIVGLKSSLPSSPAVLIEGLDPLSTVQFLIGKAAADNNASWIARK
jgi:hypothetical protein